MPNDASAYETADRLHSAAIHLLRRIRKTDDDIGLTAPKLSALSVIVFAGPCTQSELVKAEQVRPATISRLVTDLESAGLVKRVADASDGRVSKVKATAKGRRLLEQGKRNRLALLAERIASLEASEAKALADAASVMERLWESAS